MKAELCQTLLTVAAIVLLRTPFTEGVTVTNVRITGGPNATHGRLEIQVDNINTWGGVCDDGFDDKDALVACRMLGFVNGGKAELNNAWGPAISNLFLMDDTTCDGDEKNLTECRTAQVSDCVTALDGGNDNMVGLLCRSNDPTDTGNPVITTTVTPVIVPDNCQTNQQSQVRLVGKTGLPGIGFVEVFDPNFNSWGFVCDDQWSQNNARVVCRQLCLEQSNFTAKPGIPAEHRVMPNNPQIRLDDVVCLGTESRIQDCPSSAWNTNNCRGDGGELAGVQCVPINYEPPPAPVPVLECGNGRLVARFNRSLDSNLEEVHLSVFNNAACKDVTKETDATFVSILIPVDSCGTNVTGDSTRVYYNNVVKYDHTMIDTPDNTTVITRVNTYIIKLSCNYARLDLGVTQRFQPVSQSVTQSSTGNFQMSMKIFRNDQWTEPVNATSNSPVQIPLGEFLNVAVEMGSSDQDSRLKLVVDTCVASSLPNLDGATTMKMDLFRDKCAKEVTLSFYPLSMFKYGFRFRPFKFVGHEFLYIQCTALVCLADDLSNQCDRTCDNTKPVPSTTTTTAATVTQPGNNAGRRKRSALFKTVVTTMSISLYDPFAPSSGISGTDDEDRIVIVNKEPPRTKKPSTTTTTTTTISTTTTTTTTTRKTPATQKPPTESPAIEALDLRDREDNQGPPESNVMPGATGVAGAANQLSTSVMNVGLGLVALIVFMI